MGRVPPDAWGLDRRQDCPVCHQIAWRYGGKRNPRWEHWIRKPITKTDRNGKQYQCWNPFLVNTCRLP